MELICNILPSVWFRLVHSVMFYPLKFPTHGIVLVKVRSDYDQYSKTCTDIDTSPDSDITIGHLFEGYKFHRFCGFFRLP